MISIGKERYVITAALPYANGPIHIGHLVEYIQADIFTRFLKLLGKDAIYCCADDTHGTPIEIKATQLGKKPEDLIAEVYKEHLADFKAFLIDFDSYYTTNSPENRQFSETVFQALKDKALIYTKDVENYFDEKEKRFLPDRYVKGECPKCGAKDQYGDVCEKCNETYKPIDLVEPYSTISGERPIRKSSSHYFFKLSSVAAEIDTWLDENKNLQPEIVNYVKSWIKEGLQDWDISRDGPYFGFKIPGEDNKYFYVWLDAPIGYIASTANYCKDKGLDVEKDYWRNPDVKIHHFIGKDIIYFHFLFWPAMLMNSGFTLPESITVHGFLTVGGEKMSKSRGTFLTAREFLEDYEPEYLRFYYAKMLSQKMADINLDFDDFRNTVNNELVANIGNFCYRVLSFIERNYGSRIGKIDQDEHLMAQVKQRAELAMNKYEAKNLNEAMKEIMAISSIGNKYFQDNAPWKLAKEDREKAHQVLGLCANIVKILSIVTQPVLPLFSKQVQQQLGLKALRWKDIDFTLKDHKLNKIVPLIRKMEKKEEKTFPLNLKVAEIMTAENHPDADKLMVLKVNLGSEQRQIVAGIKGYYTAEELIRKKIVIISNLKYAKLRGKESQGMLLAADNGKQVKLLTVKDGKPGDPIRAGELRSAREQLTFDQFQKLTIEIKDKKVQWDGLVLSTEADDVTVDSIDEFKDGTRVR